MQQYQNGQTYYLKMTQKIFLQASGVTCTLSGPVEKRPINAFVNEGRKLRAWLYGLKTLQKSFIQEK